MLIDKPECYFQDELGVEGGGRGEQKSLGSGRPEKRLTIA